MKQQERMDAHTGPEVVFLKRRYEKLLGKAALNPSFLNTTLTNRLHAANPGDMLLIPNQLQSLQSSDDPIKATFEADEALRQTRERSVHGIQFGRLMLEGDDHIPVQEYVAYKPESVEQAVREAVSSRFINTKNVTGHTYEPLGFLKKSDGDTILITRFAGHTETFDNVLWRDQSEVTDEQVEDALSKAAISLAYLHAGGITHGDAQPKNIAWNTQSDEPWYVDLETVRRHMKYGDRKCFEDEAKYDLLTFMLFQPRMPSTDMFDLVAEKYIMSYESISNDSSPVKRDAIMSIAKKRLKKLPIL